MQGVRFLLEFAKADERLRQWGVRTTIVVLGSARIREPNGHAHGAAGMSHWYDETRRFGRIVSERGGALAPIGGQRDNVIATGGGPGIMEAANRGACDVGAPSIGFNIELPREQEPNLYSTPALTFQFHSFAMRKIHLAIRASAAVAFPGDSARSPSCSRSSRACRRARRDPFPSFASTAAIGPRSSISMRCSTPG